MNLKDIREQLSDPLDQFLAALQRKFGLFAGRDVVGDAVPDRCAIAQALGRGFPRVPIAFRPEQRAVLPSSGQIASGVSCSSIMVIASSGSES
ncbi:MAG: hypothetical protein IPK19_04760 [Chloroflexi bacterium]|nr:hypothetical protein [Chloroflexota bacterium]